MSDYKIMAIDLKSAGIDLQQKASVFRSSPLLRD